MAKKPVLVKRRHKAIRVSKSEQYIINKKYLGDEPTFTKPITNSQFILTLNWYNYMCTNSEAKEFIVEYLKNLGRVAEARKVKSVADNVIPTTLGWICRIRSRGFTLPSNHDEFIEKKLTELYKYAQEPKLDDVPVKAMVSIQDRMREKTHEILGEVEGLVDDYIDSSEEFSLYNWLQSNNIPATYATAIVSKFAPVLNELLEAFEGNCPQLKEGYAHLKKNELKKKIAFFNTLIEDAERYASNTKKVRTVRKPRTISVEKKLKGLKWQKEDATYKLASISPEKIIGAQELWTFNTKYKTLTVFRAQDRGGLQVKGTSILGYDPVASQTKGTGRQSEAIVKRALEGGKIVLRKLMDELKTDKALAYRINENTILLRVVS